jgi:hypothetical protein
MKAMKLSKAAGLSVAMLSTVHCGFSGLATDDANAKTDARVIDGRQQQGDPDAAKSPYRITHLSETDRKVGTEEYVLRASTINTDDLTITGATPAILAADFIHTEQVGGGAIAVLYTRSLSMPTVTGGANFVRIVGSRPLVIVAATTISIDDLIDANGKSSQPGPGGSAPGLVSNVAAGDGAAGIANGSGDSGGGGGGGREAGGLGGHGQDGAIPNSNGGIAVLAAQSKLLGGGAGGSSTIDDGCPADPIDRFGGAGGGALQLFAVDSVTVSMNGAINVGGGGGSGGAKCDGGNLYTSGAGGGGGGMIYVQSKTFALKTGGKLAANGGGGGSAASTAKAGRPGERGVITATAAMGGTIPDAGSGNGGNGGFAVTPPKPGQDGILGGGGGGARGRIIYQGNNLTPNGLTSPDLEAIPDP